MLKLRFLNRLSFMREPAAFGRLCVETSQSDIIVGFMRPAAFGRLCVETQMTVASRAFMNQPPSGGCVLKQQTVVWSL